MRSSGVVPPMALTYLRLRRCDHARLPRVIENSAGVHNRSHIAQRLEGIGSAARFDRDCGLVQINRHHVSRFENFAKTLQTFARIEFASGDTIAEENARKTF